MRSKNIIGDVRYFYCLWRRDAWYKFNNVWRERGAYLQGRRFFVNSTTCRPIAIGTFFFLLFFRKKRTSHFFRNISIFLSDYTAFTSKNTVVFAVMAEILGKPFGIASVYCTLKRHCTCPHLRSPYSHWWCRGWSIATFVVDFCCFELLF